MTPEIVKKLGAEIEKGLKTQAQIVYLLVGIRKILEQDTLSKEYKYLKFHCDWACHSKLTGPFAQEILGHFNSAHLHFVNGGELRDSGITNEIAQMEPLKNEISQFLKSHYLPDFSQDMDQWVQFLYLYARVIEDCPLKIQTKDGAHIQEVRVSVETTDKIEDHRLFKVNWRIEDHAEKSGSIFIIYSFPATRGSF